jgi:uncharacterized protein YcbK (DUF882 family)
MRFLHRRNIDRRRLLRWLALGPAAVSLALREQLALADALDLDRLAHQPREVSLHNLHTGERLDIRYAQDGQYLPGALSQLNHLLRDHRNGAATTIDPRLFDQLHGLATAAGCAPLYGVISGYRSPASNEQLREHSEGVARHSLHMEGRAIDVRPVQLGTKRLRELALGLEQGGVGFYAKSDFVHLDTGRVRSWTG